MNRIPNTIKHLLIINGIFFLATLLLGESIDNLFALHYIENPLFRYWQLVTHMFMHGNFTHILFNMLGLWMFGSPLEQLWGRNKFLFFYLSAGLGGAILQLLVYNLEFSSISAEILSITNNPDSINDLLTYGRYDTNLLESISEERIGSLYQTYNTVMVGASGALYGILVAFAMLFPNTELMMIFLPIPIKAKYFVPLIIVGDFFFGITSFSIGPIAHFAHLGGAIAGFIMMWYWKRNQFNRNRWDN